MRLNQPINRQKIVLYAIGIALTLAISIIEASRGRALNFYIFQDAAIDYWNGLNPYVGWSDRHSLDVFLYLPPFLPLFSTFTFLPPWLGAILWNFINFNLLFLAIMMLPGIKLESKKFIYLYPLIIFAQTLFSFQYNIAIAYMFLFAFIFLERGKYWLALLFIVLSGATKVYGFIELALFVLYPQFWKNVYRGLILLAVVLVLPAIKTGFTELVPFYNDWLTAISVHQYRPFETMTRLILVATKANVYDYGNLILGMISLFIIAFIILKQKSFDTLQHRYQLLGILMATIILWGTNSERHTYCIAILGYALWYVNINKKIYFDKILLILNFIILGIMPIDIFCPRPVLNLLSGTLALNIIIFLITWLRMCYVTFFSSATSIHSDTIIESGNK